MFKNYFLIFFILCWATVGVMAQVTGEVILGTNVTFVDPTYTINGGTTDGVTLFHGFDSYVVGNTQTVSFNTAAANVVFRTRTDGATLNGTVTTTGNGNIYIITRGTMTLADNFNVTFLNTSAVSFIAGSKITYPNNNIFSWESVPPTTDNQGPQSIGGVVDGTGNAAMTVNADAISIDDTLRFIGDVVTFDGAGISGNNIYIASHDDGSMLLDGTMSGNPTTDFSDFTATNTTYDILTAGGTFRLNAANMTFTGDTTSIEGNNSNVYLNAYGDITVTKTNNSNFIQSLGSNARTISVVSQSGAVDFTNSNIRTGTAGNITVTGDTGINFDNSEINAFADSGNAGNIAVNLTDAGTMTFENGSHISAYSDSGNGGSITITATPTGVVGNVMFDDSDVETCNHGNSGTGVAGNIIINVNGDVTFLNEADIWAYSGGGNAGNIQITAQGIMSFTDGELEASSDADTGNGGTVNITTTTGTNTITFNNFTIDSTASGATSANGGNVTISAPGTVTFQNGADIDTTGTDDSGTVSVTSTAANVLFDDSDITTGAAGTVTINGSTGVTFQADADITTSSSTDNAANVNILSSGNILFTGTSDITAQSTAATGNGGVVTIIASTGTSSVTFSDSDINTTATGLTSATGGVVNIIAAGLIEFNTGADIVTTGVTAAGLVNMNAGGTLTFDDSTITTGTAGDVIIVAAGLINFRGTTGSSITTDSILGDAGDVTINSTLNGITFTNSSISTQYAGAAPLATRNSGDVTISASGANANILFEQASSINTSASADPVSQTAGNVQISTTTGTVGFNASTITTTSTSLLGTGQGGNVTITSFGTVTFAAGANIHTSALSHPTGTSGDVLINFQVGATGGVSFDASTITTNTNCANGTAGDVTITNAPGSISFTTGSNIDASSTITGGNVNLSILTGATVGTVTFTGSTINTSSNSGALAGEGGDVTITSVGNVEFTSSSNITTSSNTHTNGISGDVLINFQTGATGGVHFNASLITTSANGAQGQGGDVTITAPGAILFEAASHIDTRAKTAGEVKITSTTGQVRFVNSDILSQSLGDGGNVEIISGADINYDGSNIRTDVSSGGTGSAGHVVLQAETNILFNASVVSATAPTSGVNGGYVYINQAAGGSGTITFQAASSISTSTLGSGDGGEVIINADDVITFTGNSHITTSSRQNAGNVTITSRGDAGNSIVGGIDFNASNIVTTSPGSLGNGGDVNLESTLGYVNFTNNNITTSGQTSGLVDITAGTAITFDNADINTSSNGVVAGAVTMLAGTNIDFTDSDIITRITAGNGTGGQVKMDATGTIDFDNSDIITESTVAGLVGGAVLINTDSSDNGNVTFTDSTINAKSSNGTGGRVEIQTNGATSGAITFENSTIITEGYTQGGVILLDSESSTISFNDSVLNSNSPNGTGGSISVIAAGNITFNDENEILTRGLVQSGAVVINAGATNPGTGAVLFDDSDINTTPLAYTGLAGTVTVTADGLVTFQNDSEIETGASGNVTITSNNNSVLFDEAAIVTSSNGGNAGNVVINAQTGTNTITFTDSVIQTQILGTTGTGNAGNVSVTAGGNVAFTDAPISTQVLDTDALKGGNVLLRSLTADVNFVRSIVNSSTLGTGNGGDITINGLNVSFTAISDITTSSNQSAGDVTIQSGPDVDLVNVTFNNSKITTTSGSTTGFGGDVYIEADGAIQFLAASHIRTTGNVSGDVEIYSIPEPTPLRNSVLFQNSNIITSSPGQLAGHVEIESTTTLTFENSNIEAQITGNGTGSANYVRLTSEGNLRFTNSDIKTNVLSDTGLNGGYVYIQIDEEGTGSVTFETDSDIDTSTVGTGNGGGLLLQAVGAVSFTGSSDIKTSARANAGTVYIASDDSSIVFTNSNITAQSTESGNGGQVRVLTATDTTGTITFTTAQINTTGIREGGQVIVDGRGTVSFLTGSHITTNADTNAGSVSITGRASNVIFTASNINAQSLVDGDGGRVSITTNGASNGAVTFTNSQINTTGLLEGGVVDIDARGQITFTGASHITTNAATSLIAGNAGNVTLSSSTAGIAFNASNINASSVNGDSGRVKLTAATTIAFDDSDIRTRNTGTGNGGLVDITATGQITFINTSDIVTSSNQDAGSVKILSSASGTAVNFDSSEINALSTNNVGGSVNITALSGAVEFENSSNITTTGSTSAGEVRILSAGVTFDQSKIRTNATGANGLGGNVILQSTGAVAFSLGSDITTSANAFSGNVEITGTTGNFSQSKITTTSAGAAGFGGYVDILTSGNMAFTTLSHITTTANTSGEVRLQSLAGAVSFTNTNITTSSAGILAGLVDIDAGTDVIFNTANINTVMTGTTSGGNVDVLAGRDILFTTSNITTEAQNVAAVNGGSVQLKTTGGNIGLTTVAISTKTTGTGDGGYVRVETTNGAIAFDAATINTTTTGAGDGGDAEVLATGNISFVNSSDITTTSNQNSGDITVASSTGTVSFDNSELISSSNGAAGVAGDIEVEGYGQVRFNTDSDINASARVAGDVTVTSLNNQVWFTDSRINTSSLGTEAGDVDINSKTNVLFETGSNIDARNTGTGTGGDVTIDAETGTITFDASTIQTNGVTNGGLVAISAGGTIEFRASSHITTTGAPAGEVTLNSDNGAISFANSQITTGTNGNVAILAETTITFNDSPVTTTTNAGNAGTVQVGTGGSIAFTNSAINTNGQASAGSGGLVNILAINDGSTITFNNSAINSSTLGNGNGGVVSVITTGQVTFQSASNITTSSAQTAGNVGILSSASGVLFNQSTINTTSGATGVAGIVNIVSENELRFQNTSTITTSARTAGNVILTSQAGQVWFTDSAVTTSSTGILAGTVDINAETNVLFENSNINATHTTGVTGTGGTVTVDATTGTVTFTNSDILANGVTNGGAVTVTSAGTVDFNAGSDIITTGTTAGAVTLTSNNGAVSFANSVITTGAAGNVDVNAGTTATFNVAAITTTTATGSAGTVNIGTVGNIAFTTSPISSNVTAGTGNGGRVDVVATGAGSTVTFDASAINSSAAGTGNGGIVNISTPGTILFQNASNINSTGVNGGNVSVVVTTAGTLTFTGSNISTNGTTQGGSVTINAPGAVAFTNAPVTSGTNAANGGVVNITSGSTVDFTNSNITSGSTGNITIVGQNNVTFNTSSIVAQSTNNAGGAISVTSNAGNLSFTTLAINSGSTNGNAGNVTLNAAGNTVTLNAAPISANSTNGNGGVVLFNSSTVNIQNASHVNASGNNGGQVNIGTVAQLETLNINGSNVTATGVNAGGQININTRNLTIQNATLNSTGANSGIIDITIPTNIAVIDNSVLNTNTMELRGLFSALNTVTLGGTANVNIYNRLTSGNGLTVNGGNVNVLAGAEFRSSGLVNGTLINNSLVAPDNFGTNNIADLRVVGTFTNAATGRLQIDLTTNAANHDRVVVTGDVNLDNRLELVFNANDVYVQGTTFDIIPFTGDLDGQFTWYHGINNEPINPNLPLLHFNVRYQEDVVEVYVRRSFFDNMQYTDPRAVVMARSLEPIANEGGGADLRQVMDVLDRLTGPQVEAALVQMGSETYDGLDVVYRHSTSLFINSVMGHLQGIPSGDDQKVTVGRRKTDNLMMLAYEGDMETLGLNEEDEELEEQAEEQARFEKSGAIFVQFLAGAGEQDKENLKRTGFDYQTLGFMVGLDIVADKNFTLGMHVGYTNSKIDFEDVGSSEASAENVFVGVHARVSVEKMFLNAMLGYAYNKYEHERNIIFGTINRTAESDFNGHTFYGSLSAGYDFYIAEHLIFTPIASVNYVYQSIEEVEEEGAGDLNLILDKRDFDSLRTGLGARIAYRIKTESMTFIPEARFLWMHEFIGEDDDLDTVLAGNPGNPMQMPVAKQNRDIFRAGAQFSTIIDENFSVRLEYDAEIEKDNVSHLGKFTLLINF